MPKVKKGRTNLSPDSFLSQKSLLCRHHLKEARVQRKELFKVMAMMIAVAVAMKALSLLQKRKKKTIHHLQMRKLKERVI